MSTVTTTKEELAQELRAARERIEILESAAMDLQHAQQELEENQIRLQKAEEVAHLGTWEMDITTGKSKWSDEFYRICGLEPGSIKPTAEAGMTIIHPEDRDRAAQAVERAITSGENYDIEKRIVRPDGTVRYVESVGEVLSDEKGEPKTLMGSFLDITKRKRAEIERENVIKDLQEALEKVQRLQGLLPICASCKKIRDDEGYWHQVETYVSKHVEVQFTHSVCPDCMRKLYPEYYSKSNKAEKPSGDD